MNAHAERFFALNLPDKTGATARETFEGMLERTKKAERRAYYEQQLACPPLPPALHYLWALFHRLRRRQGSNGFSLSPITFSEIDAFVRHAGVRLAPWELEVVEDLDDIYRATAARLHAGEPETEPEDDR